MTQNMVAAVHRGPGDLRLEQTPVPEPGPADVVIAVWGCGICGSDLHSYKFGAYIQPGQIMGHEFMGTAVKVGHDVKGVKEGDRVTGFAAGFCGKCYWCTRGQFTLCPDLFSNSTAYGRPGALAEYVRIDRAVVRQSIHLLPDVIDDEVGVTVEPVGVGVAAVETANIKAGDKVVVLGAGMIGNVCLQAARAAGAGQVVAIDPAPLRLDAAKEAGASRTFDPRSGDPVEWVKQVIGVGRTHFDEGGMADVVIDAAGSANSLAQALQMVRSAGTIVLVGLPEGPVPIDIRKVVHKQPRIVGSLGANFRRSISMLAAGEISTRRLISHRLPLSRVVDAFDIQSRPNECIKVVVNP